MVRLSTNDRYTVCSWCKGEIRIRVNGTLSHHSPGYTTVAPTRPVQYCAGGGKPIDAQPTSQQHGAAPK